MPRRTDIHSILIIGAGPIIIGQACEFDYSGAQACKALRAEGYRVILVNSNPATIMTDPGLADATYVEPITPDFVDPHHRPRKARRAAAHHGRPDGAEHRHAARCLRRAGRAWRGADRCARRGDRSRRGSSEVPRSDGGDRHRIAAQRDRAFAGRSARRAGRDRASRSDPAQLHAGWHRGRHRLQQGGVRADRAGRPGCLADP